MHGRARSTGRAGQHIAKGARLRRDRTDSDARSWHSLSPTAAIVDFILDGDDSEAVLAKSKELETEVRIER